MITTPQILAGVITGVLVIVLGQILIRFILDPIAAQRQLLGEIIADLMYYANTYCNPGTERTEKLNETSKKLRQLSSQLTARTHTIPIYRFWQIIRVVRPYNDIKKVTEKLIFLSNAVYKGDSIVNLKVGREIEGLLMGSCADPPSEN